MQPIQVQLPTTPEQWLAFAQMLVTLAAQVASVILQIIDPVTSTVHLTMTVGGAKASS